MSSRQFHGLAKSSSRLSCRQFFSFAATQLCVKPHYQQGRECVGRDHRHCSTVAALLPGKQESEANVPVRIADGQCLNGSGGPTQQQAHLQEASRRKQKGGHAEPWSRA